MLFPRVSPGLGLDVSVADHADVYLIGGVVLFALLEGVARRDGEHGAVMVEVERRDRGGEGGELAEALLVLPVPNVHEAVAAASRKSAVHGVEGDAVHRVHGAPHAVALERILLRLTDNKLKSMKRIKV